MLTQQEKIMVEMLGHPIYTVEYLEEWLSRDDNVLANPIAALSSMGAHGFYEAVKAIVKISHNTGEENAKADGTPGTT